MPQTRYSWRPEKKHLQIVISFWQRNMSIRVWVSSICLSCLCLGNWRRLISGRRLLSCCRASRTSPCPLSTRCSPSAVHSAAPLSFSISAPRLLAQASVTDGSRQLIGLAQLKVRWAKIWWACADKLGKGHIHVDGRWAVLQAGKAFKLQRVG